jgi:acetyltransferase-like isoleucine patch superfamily enzyme
MIKEICRKYRKWRRKRFIWKTYGNHTKYHFYSPQINIGDFSYGVPTVHPYDDNTRLTIGKYCSIAAGVQIILGGNHHTRWISTYAFYQETDIFSEWHKINNNSHHRGDVIIGNDVWIGRNVLILSGAEIGDGAVIGAGAVVAGKIPPYSIAVGNPARVIRHRFTPEQCGKLLQIRWWDWKPSKVNRFLSLICSSDIDKFISAVEAEEQNAHDGDRQIQ